MEPTLGASVVTDATAPHLLGMTPRAFREAVQRQGIPFVRLGARILVVVADLERLAHRNDKPAASPDDETPAATADTLLERHGFRRTT